ncbi:MAG: two-component hybrid sensor and regulator [Rhodospirillales bacterium]|nr:two-component hybrid sensor and regulator [Rhodospirillales bacterium]
MTEARRTADGNYFFQPINEALRRLLDLPAEFVGQDAIMCFAADIAHDGGIAVSAEFPMECPEIPGDLLKLKQVLLSILSNAIKFTPPGGKITAELNYTESEAMVTGNQYRLWDSRSRTQSRLPAVRAGREQVLPQIRWKRVRSFDRTPTLRPAWRQTQDRQRERHGTTVQISFPRSPPHRQRPVSRDNGDWQYVPQPARRIDPRDHQGQTGPRAPAER